MRRALGPSSYRPRRTHARLAPLAAVQHNVEHRRLTLGPARKDPHLATNRPPFWFEPWDLLQLPVLYGWAALLAGAAGRRVQ